VPDPKPTDEEQILSLINMENQIYKFGNLEQTMYIFTDESTINENTDGSWAFEGCEEIQDSYFYILDQTNFLAPDKQKSETAEVNIYGNYATAETKVFLFAVAKEQNPFNQGAVTLKPYDILLTERWTFMKQQGEWKVRTLNYSYEQ
jgi:hypothetical protein